MVILIIAILSSNRCFAAIDSAALFSTDRLVDYSEEFESQMQLTVLDEEYLGEGDLEGLYISKSGRFLLVFSEGTQHYINIYQPSGSFDFQVRLKESGSLLALINESDQQVVLFPVRDHILVEIDREGQYLLAWSITDDAYSELISDLKALTNFKIEVAGNVYTFYRENPLHNRQSFYVYDSVGTLLFSYVAGGGFFEKNFMIAIVSLLATFIVSHFLLSKKSKRSNS